jgi:HTH-type transcriptional regulator / antitoxin HigA
MKKTNEYYPESVPHPGIDLNEKLEEINMGPKEFSIRTGKPEKTVSAILKGNSSITPDMAVQFEKVLNIPARFWLQRQYHFNEYIARIKEFSNIQKEIPYLKNFPIKDMIRLMWISDADNKNELVLQLLAFFGLASFKNWENYYLKRKLKVKFRISLKHENNPYAVSVWLRKGELQALEMKTEKYSPKKLNKILPDLKNIMVKNPNNIFDEIQYLCQNAGVKVIFTHCLPKAPLNGVTRWIGENPIIQLSDRYKRYDIFWFTFFHEIGHLLLHGKKDIFIETINSSLKKDNKEKEADEFAINCTLTSEEEKEILKKENLNYDDIFNFAKKFNTHHSIIIGRLQHRGFINHYTGKDLLFPLNFNDID